MFEMLDHNGPGHFGSSFALGFSEPNFVKKTHPPTPRSGVMAAKPPDEVPDEFKEDVAKLHKPLAAILVGKEIPWAAQAALGASGYVTVEDRADRWDTPAAARENCSRDLGFRDGENGFNVQTLAFTAMRLQAAGGSQLGPGGQPRKAPLEVLCDRRQLEDAYVAIHGTPKPRLEFQGSDGYLKKQWRLIAKGELGYIPAKHIVSALPEEGERPSSTHKKITVDGWDREDEEEVRSHPTSRRQLERLHQTFRTTLLMCTAALPQFGNLKVTKAELDDWYDWFYGEDIAGRPPPSDTTLLFAERNAWRKIHEMVRQGTTLSDALKNIRGDFLFWQQEVYEQQGAGEGEEQGQGT